jgi:hypothetical protein
MSAQLKTLGGEDGGYESTERLMNKDDALESMSVSFLSRSESDGGSLQNSRTSVQRSQQL